MITERGPDGGEKARVEKPFWTRAPAVLPDDDESPEAVILLSLCDPASRIRDLLFCLLLLTHSRLITRPSPAWQRLVTLLQTPEALPASERRADTMVHGLSLDCHYQEGLNFTSWADEKAVSHTSPSDETTNHSSITTRLFSSPLVSCSPVTAVAAPPDHDDETAVREGSRLRPLFCSLPAD